MLAGCNQFYGLDQTQLRDGPGPDAPAQCHRDRVLFTNDPFPLMRRGEYTLAYGMDENRTLAVAHVTAGVVEGPVDSDSLAPATFSPAIPPGVAVAYPRIAPEGDELFVRVEGTRIERYRRTGEIWTLAGRLSIPVGFNSGISAPTRRLPDGRRIIIDGTNGLQEYVESASDQWMTFGTPFDVMASPEEPNLSPDGLYVIYRTTVDSIPRFRIQSRDDLTASFTKPIDFNPFFGSPGIYWPYMTGDCSRLYMLVVPDGVTYVKQP